MKNTNKVLSKLNNNNLKGNVVIGGNGSNNTTGGGQCYRPIGEFNVTDVYKGGLLIVLHK